jgi:glycosyltransferase involved in cell wall biosynthesis
MIREETQGEGGPAGLGVLVVGGDSPAALEATLGDLERNALRRDLRVRRAPAEGERGFLGALEELRARHPGQDIAVVTAGARLPFAWDERLRKAAHAAPGIAAAIPLCDVAPLYTLVDDDQRDAAEAALIDRSVYAMGHRRYYEVPRIHPVCAYLRGDALDAVAGSLRPGTVQQVLDQFCALARAHGRSCVILDYLYVGFAGSADPDWARSGTLEETAYLQHHPLGGLRRAVNDAIRRGLAVVSVPGLDHRPVQLHIMHFWGGGLDRWVRDFGRGDTERVNLVLATYRIGETGGQRVVLYSDPAAMIPIRTWDIARPIRSSAPSAIEYRAILEQIVEEFEVEAIIVSSLIGHALDALTLARKTIVVCHDFYPICRAINPQFRGTCEHCTFDDLRECTRTNPLNRIFVGETDEEWQAMRSLFVEHVLARSIEIAVPSPWVAETLTRLEPRLAATRIRVIPHGMDLDAPPLAPRTPGARLRLVVLGRLSLQKGLELLRAACTGLEPYADVTLLGCGAAGMALGAECGWEAIERYELEELPERLRSAAPDAGLLASVVPETFSYTLSELWALGVPPIASALGSFKERITDGVDGFLFEPNAASLVDAVRALHAEPGRLAAAARAIAARPRARSVAEMVADYHALVPLAARSAARFRVGIGRETALTEPYRHLNEAYLHVHDAYEKLSGAYEQSTKAYVDVRAAYEHVREELASLRAAWAEWAREFDGLRVGRRWWLAPRAQRLVTELRNKVNLPEKEEKQ